MRRPNYKVFVYDHCSRHYDTIKVWAIRAQTAVDKAKEVLVGRKKDPNYYTFVAREESTHHVP